MKCFPMSFYSFAFGIIDLHKHLVQRNEFTLSKQILRYGTSIGANYREINRAES